MTWTFQWINWIKGKLGKFSFVDTYSLKKLLILLSPANAGISPRRYLNFHHLFAIWWARLTLVWFSPLFTPFSLCLHFTFLSLTVALGTLFKILLFASVFIHRAETSGLIKRITLLSWFLKNWLFAVKVGRYFDPQNSTQSRWKQWKPNTILQKLFCKTFLCSLKALGNW